MSEQGCIDSGQCPRDVTMMARGREAVVCQKRWRELGWFRMKERGLRGV